MQAIMIIIESNNKLMPHLIVVFVILIFAFINLSKKIRREIFQTGRG